MRFGESEWDRVVRGGFLLVVFCFFSLFECACRDIAPIKRHTDCKFTMWKLHPNSLNKHLTIVDQCLVQLAHELAGPVNHRICHFQAADNKSIQWFFVHSFVFFFPFVLHCNVLFFLTSQPFRSISSRNQRFSPAVFLCACVVCERVHLFILFREQMKEKPLNHHKRDISSATNKQQNNDIRYDRVWNNNRKKKKYQESLSICMK